MKTQLIKTFYLFTCLILISGCKKESDLPEFVNTKTENSNENSSNGANIFTGSSQNPYSISNIRNVKTIFTTLTDPLAQTLGAAPLDQNSIWLYIRLNPTTENHYAAVENMIGADTNIHLFNHPLDTPTYITSTWEEFSESNFINQFYADDFLYTVIRVSSSVRPENIPYVILDTLYIPNDNEPYLDFFAHMITNNIDNQTMDILESNYPELYDTLFANDSLLVHINWDQITSTKDKYKTNSIISGAFNSVFGGLSAIFNGASNLMGWGTEPDGYLYVYDDAQAANVPVMGCRVDAIHWGKTVSGWTDVAGHFHINRRFWFGSLVTMVFDNGLCKIKQFDTHGGWVATVPIQWILNAATHISGFYSASQMGNLTKTYTAHTQVRFWSMITNGAHESFFMNLTKGITPNLGRLTIVAHWADNPGGASTPMLGYVGLVNFGMQWILQKLGAPSFNTSPMPRMFWGWVPDITIRMDGTSPDYKQNFGYLKETLFHELAHASHYFKVGNSFWTENITHSLATGSGYGGDPATDADAAFLCLTEGWAEFIGQTYAKIRYPNFVAFDHYPDQNTLVPNIYGIHLEENDHFFNTYIPKGLFYDLMDEEPGPDLNEGVTFDLVSNYSNSQIFQCLTTNVKTIPDFKNKLLNLWGGNTNQVNTLFSHYGF